MKKIRWLLAILLMLTGICVMLYPWGKAVYFNRLQHQAMQQWIDTIKNPTVVVDDTKKDIGVNEKPKEVAEEVWEENEEEVFDVAYVSKNMEGILTIPKIKLESPILTGVTKYQLDISICSVSDTGKAGQFGNYVLAGHKSRIYGRHFNRLLEVSIGDDVIVNNGSESFTYKVVKVFSVNPTELWVMDAEDNKKMITLITCDYRMNPTGRFIVKGELVENQNK